MVKKLTGEAAIMVSVVGLDSDFPLAFAGQSAAPYGASPDELLRWLDRQKFDLVAVGRALPAVPDWVLKMQLGNRENLTSFQPETLQTRYQRASFCTSLLATPALVDCTCPNRQQTCRAAASPG